MARGIGTEARATAQEVRTSDKTLADQMRHATKLPVDEKRRLVVLREEFIRAVHAEIHVPGAKWRRRRWRRRRAR
jgi:hypothetical protein